MKILLAEADVASRQALEAALVNWGYQVVIAPDGDSAWVALQGADAPKLAILGSIPTGMDGLEVCRKVRERASPYVYVLLLTAGERRDAVVAGLEAGADDFLAKPSDEHELKARLRAGRRILDLQEALRDAQEAYQFEAKHDSLTGVWNRAAILDLLRNELARAIRERNSVGVVMVDIDRFKAINETYGHIAGDAVLREAVRRMGSLVRSYDGIGRYGAEEFLVVLPGCDKDRALSMAQRIRDSVVTQPIQLSEAAISVTISVGVTSGGEGGAVGPEVLIAGANGAMSRAMRAGGNRVELAMPDDLAGGGRAGQP